MDMWNQLGIFIAGFTWGFSVCKWVWAYKDGAFGKEKQGS